MPKLRVKNDYQSFIWEYKHRRELLRKKYGFKAGLKMPTEYVKRVKGLNKKLRIWQRAIKRHEAVMDKIKVVDTLVMEFMNCSTLRGSNFSKTKSIAKKIFYKYGIENKIQGIKLGIYVGAKHDWTAGRNRMEFTKSFKTKTENKILYHQFLNYAKNR